ncbi:Protein phosphatase 2C family protein [Babesia bovis T2Bo]|nr:Protein phosphatase 2C family protein [Babesia bovis T2Bo]EDO06129.2 Protein phosphatase 2C family protein [Babesia bovis T2Bo]
MNVQPAECDRQTYSDHVSTESLGVFYHRKYTASVHRELGNRLIQEDRFVFAPYMIPERNDVSFFGIFDGTGGPFAADTIQNTIIEHMVSTDAWKSLMTAIDSAETGSTKIRQLAATAMKQAYANADKELLELCQKTDEHYTASTGVTVLLIKDYIVVAHVGDSRAAICYEDGGAYVTRFITTDHKPHSPDEKRRIKAAGGIVVYSKTRHATTFLRCGDYLKRHARGERPMQIQYSRAFGGKELKRCGLLCEPDVSIYKGLHQHKALIIASDGLWNVFKTRTAFTIVLRAHSNGKNPSITLVESAIMKNTAESRNSDNITSIVIIFNA